MTQLIPRNTVPELSVELLDGERWTLSEEDSANFTLVIFYRGLHCPLCGLYLKDVDQAIADFTDRGVNIVAISSDNEDRTVQAKEKWDIKNLRLGYGLSLEKAVEWGLFISEPRGAEPGRFSEPGNFFVRPDGTLYASIVQTMPFTRPPVSDLLRFLTFVIEKDYPARGEFELS